MNGRSPLDPFDSRVVLIGYGATATTIGLTLIGWGMRWLHGPVAGNPYGVQSLVQTGGAAAAAMGVAALGVASIDDPRTRRRVLGFFAAGQVLIALVAWMVLHALWDYQVSPLVLALFTTVIAASALLVATWARPNESHDARRPTGLLGLRPAPSRPLARSHYEAQMREVAAQEERNRLARDLHDSIKQQLFVVNTAAATAEARLDRDAAGARDAMATVRAAARDSMADMETLLDQLRATPLEQTSLAVALTRQCDALRLRSGLHVTCDIEPLPPIDALPPGAHLGLFRMAQEALSNVARHARATTVRVHLRTASDTVELDVVDDGAGYRAAETRPGMGLENIRERARELGGTASITSAPGSGTHVAVSIPFENITPRRFLGRALLWAVLGGLNLYQLRGGPASQRPLDVFMTVLFSTFCLQALLAARRSWRLSRRPR